jgi:hypothetical protein
VGGNQEKEKSQFLHMITCPCGSEQDRIDAYKCRVSSIHINNMAIFLSVDELILIGFHNTNLVSLKLVMMITT